MAGWDWWSFAVGMALGTLAGAVAMWIAGLLAGGGGQADTEDEQGREHWR